MESGWLQYLLHDTQYFLYQILHNLFICFINKKECLS